MEDPNRKTRAHRRANEDHNRAEIKYFKHHKWSGGFLGGTPWSWQSWQSQGLFHPISRAMHPGQTSGKLNKIFKKCGSPVEFAALYIHIRPGLTICRTFWVIKVQIMTEEIAYSSLIVITMSMNTKSWIFHLTQRVDFGEWKHIFGFKH